MTKEEKLSKQELEIAMAACCVGTMWDEYEGTENFDHMVRLRLHHLIDLVRKCRSSLPSNLDEAADEYCHDRFLEGDCTCIGMSDAFKAGAEWMAGQGETKEGEVFDDNDFIRFPDGAYIDLNPSLKLEPAFKFKDGDNVIVQIRKK